MNGCQCQTVGANNPKYDYADQNQQQHSNFGGGDGQNIAYKIFVVFCKTTAVIGCNEDTQCNSGAGENTNQSIRCLVTAAAHIREKQRKDNRKYDGNPGRAGNAENCTDGDAGKCGMPQSVGKETHPSGDDHGRANTEQGCQK